MRTIQGVPPFGCVLFLREPLSGSGRLIEMPKGGHPLGATHLERNAGRQGQHARRPAFGGTGRDRMGQQGLMFVWVCVGPSLIVVFLI